MATTFNANFTAKLNSQEQAPIWVLRMTDRTLYEAARDVKVSTDMYDTLADKVYFSTSGESISGLSATVYPYIVGFESLEHRITNTLKYELGQLMVYIEDKNNVLTSNLSAIYQRLAFLYMGFSGLNWSDFEYIFIGIVDRVEMIQPGLFRLTITNLLGILQNDIGRWEDKDAYKLTLRLWNTRVITENEPSVNYLIGRATVKSKLLARETYDQVIAKGFPTSGYLIARDTKLFNQSVIVKYTSIQKEGGLVDSERCQINAEPFDVVAMSNQNIIYVTGGLLNTWPAHGIFTEASEAPIQNVGIIHPVRTFIKTHPLIILLKILVSTGTGVNGAYDDLLEEEGLGLPEEAIDVTQIASIATQYSSMQNYIWCTLHKRYKAIDFLRALTLPWGFFLTVNAKGKLSIADIRATAYSDPSPSITDSDIIEVLGVEMGSDTYTVDEVKIRYSFDIAHNDDTKPLNEDVFSSAVSTEEHFSDFKNTLEINCYGLEHRYIDDGINKFFARAFDAGIASVWKWFFRNDLPIFHIKVRFKLLGVDVGDFVELSSNYIYDNKNNQMGITNRVCLVVSKRVVFPNQDTTDGGYIELTLLDTELERATRRYGKIMSSTATSDYLSASTAERENGCYICDHTTKKMSNGDDGYRIS